MDTVMRTNTEGAAKGVREIQAEGAERRKRRDSAVDVAREARRVRRAWVQRNSDEIYCDGKSKKGRVAREASVGRGKCQKRRRQCQVWCQ